MNLARYKLPAAFLVPAIAVLAVWGGVVFSQDRPTGDRAQFQKQFEAGNFKDAYEGFRKLALDAGDDPLLVGADLNQALSALQQLGRLDEIDELRESVVKVHAKNWRLRMAAADTYLNCEHFGFIIAGKFTRGPHRGGGEAVNSTERDRVRALQLMVDALPAVANESKKSDVANFWLAMARMLLGNRGYNEAWHLQYQTDLSTLPDYDRGWYGGGDTRGAPVDDQGNPVYYKEPMRWEAAETDGQRWRYALGQAVENDPSKKNDVRYQFAEFLQSQFGVQTMAYYNRFFNRLEDEGADTAEKDPTAKKDESGVWALHTLGDDETIAKLANGIKRFKLPDEFSYLQIYQQVADDPKTGRGEDALQQLAQIYENRRQYTKAAAFWERSIKEYGSGNNNFKKQRLDQIVGNWGRFDTVMSQPADRGATVDFQFRNGSKVSFEAHEINVAKLLDDVKRYLKSNPRQLDWQKVNIGDVGYRLVQENQSQYVGKRVAQWDVDLKPRPDHFDRRITVSTPLQKAGAYLVTAKMAGGNTSKIVLWLEDTAIVKKPLGASGTYYFIADAVTGAAVSKANVEFFGYRQRATGNNRFNVDIRNYAEATDENGQIISKPKDKAEEYQWLITATTPGGRLAYLGFTGIWSGTYYDAEYNQTKVFTITDRPVYRPDQKVRFKFWVCHARYDSDEKSEFANQTFNVEIQNPRGEKVLTKAFTADAFGGLEGEYDLPADATLGVYQLFVVNYGGGNFRVEEYKKSEFEVTIDAPSDPATLGERIKATIQAKYYFGSPVTEAKVKYKVTRANYEARWYPLGRWDWLYGPGYWWFAPDYSWYPGWRSWGCMRPIFSWWPGFRSRTPPEIVAEREVLIGPDGKVDVEIDTALAKLIHPDEDHQYIITAEVVDQSRRTIVGSGNVLVARKPFTVYAWLNRGFYKVGETIRADFQAQTLDQKSVAGKGVATLYQISYAAEQANTGEKEIKPVETAVRTWQIDPDNRGHAELRLEASAAGQYRLAYKVTDEKGHTIEGAYLFTIAGADFDSSKFQFNDLELIPNEREYSPGQTVNLMINANRANGTVLLFLRPSNGVYLQPKILRLKNKSAMDEIAVVQKDMPNFFIEAVTISGGKLFTETREIIVPPERRVIAVEVTPSSETYKPGEKAAITLKLTDSTGKPFLGSTVVAIYDKAVEYVSGGSNVQDIKAFFWKWRRSHYSQGETNLMRMFANLVPNGQQGMDDLGIFGGDANGEDGTVTRFALDRSGGGGPRFQALAKSNSGIAPETAAPAPMAAGAAVADLAGTSVGESAPLAEPTIRTNFADTALWAGALQTDENGFAKVSLTMPENLTTWKIRAWAMGHGTRVGQDDVDVVTRKNLIVRLQAPRFFVEKDEVVLSANVHNYLKSAKQVTVSLDLAGKCLTALGDTKQQVQIPEGGEVRVDWRVKVAQEGEATIRMKALSDEESDAVEQRFPVYVHGMRKTESFTGSLRPEDAVGKISLKVPNERRAEQTRLEVRYSPTLAGAMVDALPYLVDYPHGCTEQTLNRFLPTVITQRVLIDVGLDLKKIEDKRTNLNSQQIGNDKQRVADWKQLDRSPVFDQAEVASMVKDGVQRLAEMQLSDGGWGWFSGWGEQSYPHTTAVVVHGLQIAKENDAPLVPGMLDRGVAWLKNYQDRQVQLLQNALVKPKAKDPNKTAADNLDALVYMVLVDAGITNGDMRGFLYRDRPGLAVYSKAMFALALAKQGGQKEQLDMLLENIHQFVVEDEENQTAYLKLPENNYWWFWYGSDTEANAYYLKLLAKTDPKGKLASRLVKYVLNNRQHGAYWKSTRDTALSIEALANYLKASGEGQPDLTVEVWLDGKKQKEVKITATDLFTFDNKFVLEGDAISAGEHKLEIRKSGSGPLYYSACLTNFTLEDYIRAAGLEVKINRKFYKLTPVDKSIKVSGSRGQAIDQKVEKYERAELQDLSTLASGDLVEVELEIDSKNDYEYLLFEDFKAAGFEPTDVRSGYTGNALGAYTEFHDNRVAFFIRSLPRGKHSVSYRLRAEIPGRFSALPAAAAAMYAPELKANSDETKLKIAD